LPLRRVSRATQHNLAVVFENSDYARGSFLAGAVRWASRRGILREASLPDGLVGDDVAMSVRTCIFALACLLAGAILFVGACLGAIVFLFDRHCGPAFGYYGCDIPTAK
jgi:hypothetical protein